MPTSPIARIEGFALVVSVLADAEAFFVEAFDAVVVDRGRVGRATASLVGCPDATIARASLRIGRQKVDLLAFDPPGRPYPRDDTSTDLAFQHLAIIVSDMDAAYARLPPHRSSWKQRTSRRRSGRWACRVRRSFRPASSRWRTAGLP